MKKTGKQIFDENKAAYMEAYMEAYRLANGDDEALGLFLNYSNGWVNIGNDYSPCDTTVRPSELPEMIVELLNRAKEQSENKASLPLNFTTVPQESSRASAIL